MEDIDEFKFEDVGGEVDVDSKTNTPVIIGNLSRGFDPTFPQRYLDFYSRISSDDQSISMAALSELRDGADGCIKFIEYCCRTFSRDKQTGRKEILCFELFESQKKAVRQLYECWKEGRPAVFFKSRQQGASWLSICFCFWLAIMTPNGTNEDIFCSSKDIEILHQLGNLNSLMEKFFFLYNNLHPYIRKKLIHRFERRKYFFNINDSTIEGGITPRSGSYTFSINDEFAFNEHNGELLAALAPCCLANIYVSTLNTRGDEYDRMVNDPVCVKIDLSWRDDPQILDKEAYKKKTVAEMGQHRFNVEVDRMYSDADILRIFDPDVLDAVKLKRPATPSSGNIIAGFDVAGMGSDFNVLWVRQGHTLLYKDKWNKTMAHTSVDRIIEVYKNTQKFDILIFDEIGVGYAIASEFERRINSLPFIVQGVSFNAEAGEKGIKDPLIDEEERMIFFNLRSKLHWKLKDILDNTHIDADVWDQSELLYLHDEETIKEMYNIPQDEKNVKKMKVVPKTEIRKLLGFSPNNLDALLMTYAAEPFLARAEIENYFYGNHRLH